MIPDARYVDGIAAAFATPVKLSSSSSTAELSDAGVSVLHAQLESMEPLADCEQRRAMSIDTTQTPKFE